MLEYRVRLSDKYRSLGARLFSVVVYLTPEGHPGAGANRLVEAVFGQEQLVFQFHEVRLWEVPARPVLEHDWVGLLPLVPLMHGADEPALTAAVQRVNAVVPEAERADLLVGLNVLGGLRFSQDVLARIIRREAMIKSVTLEAILEEGREQGREEGREKGREEGMIQKGRQDTLRLLQQRFDTVPELVAQRVTAAETLEAVDRLFDRAMSCSTLDEFLGSLP